MVAIKSIVTLAASTALVPIVSAEQSCVAKATSDQGTYKAELTVGDNAPSTVEPKDFLAPINFSPEELNNPVQFVVKAQRESGDIK